MTEEILAVIEHLVLRRMTNDAAALTAYRSDPVQARYQSWEALYLVDRARGADRRDAQRASAQPIRNLTEVAGAIVF
ncbi:hypothetical protein [Arthrobacter sp. TMN-50]